MSTRIHQTWDIGDGSTFGELTFDLSHSEPLPVPAYPILAALVSDLQATATALRQLMAPMTPEAGAS